MIKNPKSFLKIASATIAFGVLLFGVFANEKNEQLFSNVEASLNEASVISDSANPIPTVLGNCQQSANLQAKQSIFAQVGNLDAIITGTIPLETKVANALTSAIKSDRLEVKVLKADEKYEFIVKDGQADFWKCILAKDWLFSSVSAENATFFSKTEIFNSQIIEKFGLSIGEINNTDKFLNFVELAGNQQILESTILNAEGEVLFKIFETELKEEDEMTYSDLRKKLRKHVGITNLRPAVFGADSYYWMWGAEEKMAASVFPVGEKVFGVSYQTVNFKSIRRAMDALRDELASPVKKVGVRRMSEDLKFENKEETGVKLANELSPENADGEILAGNLMGDILDAEPIEIPEEAAEMVEKLSEELPVDLN